MPTLIPLENTLKTLCERLAVWQSRFPAPIDDLQHLAQAFAAKLARLSALVHKYFSDAPPPVHAPRLPESGKAVRPIYRQATA